MSPPARYPAGGTYLRLFQRNRSTLLFELMLSELQPLSIDTLSLIIFGAASTNSFASLSPSPVISRIALMTLTFCWPKLVSSTSNSVCFTFGPGSFITTCSTGAAEQYQTLFHTAFASSISSVTAIPLMDSRISEIFCFSIYISPPFLLMEHKGKAPPARLESTSDSPDSSDLT